LRAGYRIPHPPKERSERETVQIGVMRGPKRDHGLWDRENYVSLQAANGHPSVGHAAGPPGVGVAGRAIVLRP